MNTITPNSIIRTRSAICPPGNSAPALGHVALALWGLYYLCFPFYPMGRTLEFPTAKTWAPKYSGGVPQPADYVMAGCMALAFAGAGFSVLRPTILALRMLGLFTCYVGCVNCAWGTWLGDWSVWKMSAFYGYDFLLVFAFLVLYSHCGDRLLRVVVHAAAASVFLQVLLSPWAINPAWSRQPLFFHNENHLGYFVVLSATIFHLGTRYVHVSWSYRLCFYTAIGYLALLAVSKAAIAGLLLLALLAFVSDPRRLLPTALAGGGLLLVTAALFPDKALRFAATFETRLSLHRTDDSWAGRGYDRIANHPEYLLFGAGEGAYYRFHSAFRGELHSSLGTFLFCYGLVGITLFASGIFLACRPRLTFLAYLGPAMVHGMAHQGLRFSLFWVLVALLCCLAHRQTNDNPTERCEVP